MSAPETPRHPRQGQALEDLETQARAVCEALARGRLHHAWLLGGPEGSGKAGFAYQLARRLLGAAPDPAAGPLASRADDPVARMVAARSHPDLLVLERDGGEAGGRRSIPVDEARRLPEFFAKSPAVAAWRVAIIDAADDLNVNAANAVLKTLEEPTGRGVVLLVSHSPGRLLATLRSRCRRLDFPPWPAERLAAFVSARTGLDAHDAERLAALADGAPGRALTLAAEGALALDSQVGAVLDAAADPDRRGLLALADSLRGGEGARRFALLMETLARCLRERATAYGAEAGEGAQAWSVAWREVQDLPGRVEALNLDRTDAFWTVMADLRRLVRNHPLATAAS